MRPEFTVGVEKQDEKWELSRLALPTGESIEIEPFEISCGIRCLDDESEW